MPEESSSRFDSETYSKAKDSLKSTEAPSLEEKIKLAKEQEAAAKKVADDVIRSQGFAKKGNEELNLSRTGAADVLKLGFDDFTQPVMMSPDTKPLTFNQNPSNREPRIPEKGAKPTVESRTNTPTEVTSTNSTQTIEKPDTITVLGNGDTQEKVVTQQAEVAQNALKSGNPDKLQDIKNTLRNVYSNGPDRSNEQTKEKTPEEKELLAKLEGTEINLGGNKAKLDTSKITLEKTLGSNNFKLKSTQNGFQYIDGPLEVNPDGKIQVPNNTIALKGIPWYVPGINDGKYSLSQVGKTIDIKPITTSEGLKA